MAKNSAIEAYKVCAMVLCPVNALLTMDLTLNHIKNPDPSTGVVMAASYGGAVLGVVSAIAFPVTTPLLTYYSVT